ncbi:transposase domain-containing protein [Streptomyces sp. B21-101]|uniref:transposase domain-containing protein n=1 Tax=unclassified Streptomyces TaxID=2593676 RepID=UPI003FA6B907
MVYFTLAPALFHQDSYDDVADHLVGGIPELSCCFPHKASFTRARERLGRRFWSGSSSAWQAHWPREGRWAASCWMCRTTRPAATLWRAEGLQ